MRVKLRAMSDIDRRTFIVGAAAAGVLASFPRLAEGAGGKAVDLSPVYGKITEQLKQSIERIQLWIQQPSISEISVQTTVAVPDGGTVVLGGLKTLSEGRNEFGPPVLSNIPYLNRLFRNHGIGRETRHIMIMVTPRIIIQSEEEFNQTQIQAAPVAGIGGSGS